MESFIVCFTCKTDKAIGVKELPDADDIIWLPLSQIEIDDVELDSAEKGDDIEVNIPTWLAEEKGLL